MKDDSCSLAAPMGSDSPGPDSSWVSAKAEDAQTVDERPRKGNAKFLGLPTVALRICILFLSLLSRTYVPFFALRLIRSKFRSALLVYAGNKSYARHYCFEFTEAWLKWFPTPIGIYRQGRYWGIVFASPMTEEDFTAPRNAGDLLNLIERLKRIARIAGVENVHLAGILPSFLEKRNPEINVHSNVATAKVVAVAAVEVMSRYFGQAPVPIILLGGNGKIGKALQQELSRDGSQLHIVDPVNGLAELPEELRGKKCLLIDVARREALDKYVHQLWPEMIILNEAFPEPRGKMLRAIVGKGVKTLHLAGVAGRVFPSFPHGYASSVPCCAMHDFSHPLKPVIMEL